MSLQSWHRPNAHAICSSPWYRDQRPTSRSDKGESSRRTLGYSEPHYHLKVPNRSMSVAPHVKLLGLDPDHRRPTNELPREK